MEFVDFLKYLAVFALGIITQAAVQYWARESETLREVEGERLRADQEQRRADEAEQLAQQLREALEQSTTPQRRLTHDAH